MELNRVMLICPPSVYPPEQYSRATYDKNWNRPRRARLERMDVVDIDAASDIALIFLQVIPDETIVDLSTPE